MKELDCYQMAEQFIGVKEVPGPEHNPTIVGWLKRFAKNLGKWGKGRDETAWCAVFVSMVLQRCGIEGTNHALASKYATWGKPAKPDKGVVIVIKRKKEGPDSRTGSRAGYHVGFLNRITKRYYVILGGNQSNRVRVSYFPKAKYELVALRHAP